MGSNDLTIRDGWIARVLRALNVVEVGDDGQTTHVAGSDFVSAQPAKQDYAAIDSMSAIAAFPFVRACVESIASDLTKLPIRVIKGRGADAEVIEDHPLLALLDRPSSRVSGVVFRRQLITDLVLTGNAYVLIAGAPEPAAMLRLHPERVRIIPAPDGQPMAYEYDGYGSMVRYDFDQVLHIRQTSWAASPTMLYGTGAIQALNNDLKTDQAASKLAAESASTGLPTGILSPSEEGDRWTKNQITQLREGFERQLRSKSGTVILGAGIDYTQMSQSLRDMEYQATREHVIRSILAAMGVPPVIVGLPNANYATAQAQRRQFAESQQARASLIDSELTRLARMFPDSEDVRVFHDFADVDALQESRTERVNRVQTWWFMGLSVEDAAALEGFEELTTTQPTTDDRDEKPEPTEEPETAGVIRLLFAGDVETRGLSDLTQPIQEGLKRKAEDHNDEIDERGMAEWRKTTAGTLARVFERGIGAYETNPESVRPSVNSAEQWAYARVNSFLYALRNDRFRSGRHDTDLLPDEHPMASDEEKTKAVGDVDPTNFPQDGDDKTVNLRNSNHKVFDPEFAERIKLDYPSIWRKGGNIKGNDQFRKLRPIALAGGVVETRAEEKAVRDREAWAARHAGDFRIAGVIAQVKWLVVGNRGEKYMKDLIREEIEKIDQEKAAKWMTADAPAPDLETADGRAEVWRNFIKNVHGPGEKRIAAITRRYLRGYGARVAQRLEENAPKGKGVTRALDDALLAKILDDLFEGRELGRLLTPVYRSITERALRDAYRTIDLDEGIDPVAIQNRANAEVARMTRLIQATTNQQVATILQDGFSQGATIGEIQANLVASAAFTPQRALTIARTEATRLANQGAADAYREAENLGMKLEKQWLHSRDEKVRETHLDLEAKGWIPMNSPFESLGSVADVPGGFGVAREDINCRCTFVARRARE